VWDPEGLEAVEKRKISLPCPCRDSNLGCPVRSLFTIPTELSRHVKNKRKVHKNIQSRSESRNLTHCIRKSWRLYPLYSFMLSRIPGGSQSLLSFFRESNPGHPVHSLVTKLPELPGLLPNVFNSQKWTQ
jgi:hypothetical protein